MKRKALALLLVVSALFMAMLLALALPKIFATGNAVLQAQQYYTSIKPAGFSFLRLNFTVLPRPPGDLQISLGPNIIPGDFQTFCSVPDVSIESNIGRSVVIPYCTSLVNSNGAKFHFHNMGGNFTIYLTKKFGQTDYLLDLQKPSYLPFNYNSLGAYSRGERLIVNSYNRTAVNVTITANCDGISPYCYLRNWSNGANNISKYYTNQSGLFTFHLERAGFESEQVMVNFFNKLSALSVNVTRFMNTTLGFLPSLDKYVVVKEYRPGGAGGGYSANNIIYWVFTRITTQQDVDNLRYGDAHELTHVFFYSAPVKRGWFEEGLADYLSHRNTLTTGIYCNGTGWKDTPTGTFVPYSNFSARPDDNAGLYDNTSRRAYYASAECFWVYLNDTYGWNAVKQVLGRWQDTRKQMPPQEKWLIKDIINPTLNADLAPLVLQRYSYREQP